MVSRRLRTPSRACSVPAAWRGNHAAQQAQHGRISAAAAEPCLVEPGGAQHGGHAGRIDQQRGQHKQACPQSHLRSSGGREARQCSASHTKPMLTSQRRPGAWHVSMQPGCAAGRGIWLRLACLRRHQVGLFHERLIGGDGLHHDQRDGSPAGGAEGCSSRKGAPRSKRPGRGRGRTAGRELPPAKYA